MALKPGDWIGIIGGGQLGRMLAMAAARLGFKTIVLDPQNEAPAFQCANEALVAEYEDEGALAKLAERCSAITYEFENVSVTAVRKIAQRVTCHPNANALETSQDRLVEKQFFNGLGIETAPFAPVDDPAFLTQLLADFGGEGILKTRRFGYDGKGQIRLSTKHEPGLAEGRKLASQTPCILEGLVDFEREVSVIAARGEDGSLEAFDIAENLHSGGILRRSTVPANIPENLKNQANEIARSVLGALDYVGIIAIELFALKNGSLVANEYAPRVHNSGHWTEAACPVSQFEQHIRAISGLPLADTARHSDCIMENLIGEDMQKVPEIHQMAATVLHLYGKNEVKHGRKMGHFTRIFDKK